MLERANSHPVERRGGQIDGPDTARAASMDRVVEPDPEGNLLVVVTVYEVSE
ncbi:MAG: hypothetical protein ABJC89_27710 [Acidobacteriota bacterium]